TSTIGNGSTLPRTPPVFSWSGGKPSSRWPSGSRLTKWSAPASFWLRIVSNCLTSSFLSCSESRRCRGGGSKYCSATLYFSSCAALIKPSMQPRGLSRPRASGGGAGCDGAAGCDEVKPGICAAARAPGTQNHVRTFRSKKTRTRMEATPNEEFIVTATANGRQDWGGRGRNQDARDTAETETGRSCRQYNRTR